MKVTIESAIEAAVLLYEVEREQIIGDNSDRPVVEARAQISAICYANGIKQKDIAKELNKTSPSVGHYRILHSNLMETSQEYRDKRSEYLWKFIDTLGLQNQRDWEEFYHHLVQLRESHPNDLEFFYEIFLLVKSEEDNKFAE